MSLVTEMEYALIMPRGYVPNDRFARKAKEEGYRARSVFKLQELDTRFKLFTPGMRVLDVGAAPGSWLQYAAQRVGERGGIIGLDLQEIAPIAPNVETFVTDITDPTAVEKVFQTLGIKSVELVLADAAPKTTGIKDVDQWRSIELNEIVRDIAEVHLRRGGTTVMKVFRGADFDPFLASLKPLYKLVKVVSAKASRTSSSEVYIVCLKKLGAKDKIKNPTAITEEEVSSDI